MFTILDNKEDITFENIKELIIERTSEILRENDKRFIDITMTEGFLAQYYHKPVIISASFSTFLDDFVLVFPTDYFEFHFEVTYPIFESYLLADNEQFDNLFEMIVEKIAQDGAKLIMLLLNDYQGILNKNTKKYHKYKEWIG